MGQTRQMFGLTFTHAIMTQVNFVHDLRFLAPFAMVSERLRSSPVTVAAGPENFATKTLSKARTTPRKAPRAGVMRTARARIHRATSKDIVAAVVVVVASTTVFLPPTARTTTKGLGRGGRTLRANPKQEMTPRAG